MSQCARHGGDCAPDAACWTDWSEANNRLRELELQNGELAEALKAFLAVDNGGFETRNAAENSYCPDCANESDSWRDQTEHHAGCGYLARIEAAKAAISKATIPTTPEKRKCCAEINPVNRAVCFREPGHGGQHMNGAGPGSHW